MEKSIVSRSWEIMDAAFETHPDFFDFSPTAFLGKAF